MGFLLAVLSFVVAEQIVELEPVRAGQCSTISGLAPCQAVWYCAYANAACVNDPCLKVQDTDVGCELGHVSKEGVDCEYYPGVSGSGNLSLHDCSATPSAGGYCAHKERTATNYLDYCAYASLRDSGTCPQSICKKDSAQDGNCVPNNVGHCTMLSEGDCKLTPKCYWSSNSCLNDPCFAGTGTGGSTNEGQVCAGTGGWIPTTAYDASVSLPAGLVPGDCSKEYKPYKNGGGITTYCIYKDHADNPNLCYFLGNYGNDTSSPDDYFKQSSSGTCSYSGTFPTYHEFSGTCVSNPECTAAVPGCDGVQECVTKYNPTGAFAGQYCGDATHGAATSLRIPSLIALLVIAIFTFFNWE